MLTRTHTIKLIVHQEQPKLDGGVILAAKLAAGWVDLRALTETERAVVIGYATSGQLRNGFALAYEYA